MTFGKIRDSGKTKSEVIAALNKRAPISQPTFDRRLKDQQWLYDHVEVLKELGLWEQ